MSTQFDHVSIAKKANVYFGGKCVSHNVVFPDGTKKRPATSPSVVNTILASSFPRWNSHVTYTTSYCWTFSVAVSVGAIPSLLASGRALLAQKKYEIFRLK